MRIFVKADAGGEVVYSVVVVALRCAQVRPPVTPRVGLHKRNRNPVALECPKCGSVTG